MRAEHGGRGALRASGGAGLVVLLALLLVLTGCATGPDPIALPTFPAAGRQGPTATAADSDGAVPDDCGRILATGDLEAVLGLPLGSVSVRTILGVAQQSNSRTERTSCYYTGPGRRPLLDVDASAYADDAAAMTQWRINTKAESGQRRDVPLGRATAALFERSESSALLIAYASSNLTLELPDQPLPGGRDRGVVLADLALRMLPSIAVVPASAPRPTAPGTVAAQPTGAGS